jgi:hypothetical protein
MPDALVDTRTFGTQQRRDSGISGMTAMVRLERIPVLLIQADWNLNHGGLATFVAWP